jgi:hypothetical protein
MKEDRVLTYPVSTSFRLLYTMSNVEFYAYPFKVWRFPHGAA